MSNNFEFVEENKTKAKIKVIGVGGCGGNAANAMLDTSLAGEVGLYAINTDAQALAKIRDGCECVQIGQSIAKGLGVGADHEKARQAAEQDRERIEEIVDGSDMVFIAAGMGGGTGTGAAPVIAEICRENHILTVAVVTKPFSWENRHHNTAAGIEMLQRVTDSIIIVPNDRIGEVYGKDLTVEEAFKSSDSILSNAVSGICEIIYVPGRVNVDFADVKKVMSEMGQAMMGTATEGGVDRAARAAKKVIDCPLLEGIKLANARGVLVNITADLDNFKISELEDIMQIIRETSEKDANIFFGQVNNAEMGEEIRITLVATGLNGGQHAGGGSGYSSQTVPLAKPSPRLIRTNRNLNANQGSLLGEGEDLPAMLRKQHN